MKKYLPIIAIVCAVAAIAFLLRSCNLGNDYRIIKNEYKDYKLITEADHEIQQGIILKSEEVITQKTEQIKVLSGNIVKKDATISQLKGQLEGIQSIEPPTTPEIEAMPIVINLRTQVLHFKQLFDLSQNVVADQEKVISAWEVKYNAQVDISEAWKQDYENEHRLRVAAEGLVASLEPKVRAYKFRSRALTLATSVAVGYIAYSVIKDAVGK